MGLTDIDAGQAMEPPRQVARGRPRRFVSELETDIRRLYLRMMDEPVPARLIGVLRAGLEGSKP